MKYSISLSIQSPTKWLLGIDRFLPKSLIPEALYTKTLTNITFSDEKELETNLDKLLSDYNSKDGLINFFSQQSLSMTTKTKNLPSYVGNCFANINKKYPLISQVNIDDKFLTKEQQSQVQKLAENADLKRQRNNSAIRNHFLLAGALFAISMGALSLVAAIPMTLGFIIANSLKVAMITGLFSFCRQIYFENALNHYTKKGKLIPINNPSEKQAFDMGKEAANWKGYFLSCVKPSTYAYPVAFAAGMQNAVHKINEPEKIAPQTKRIALDLDDYIDFKKIDQRIIHNGGWAESDPMQTTIEIPTAHFDEIMAKLKKHPDINNGHNDLYFRPKRNKI